ncbi:MAG TPA: trypsin-like peptidase domain-containing protein [Verrucomicrobiae bacterium]|nr:trypsin-like peptidase domain-containing protein [Verrucomicrobiae bacterium]
MKIAGLKSLLLAGLGFAGGMPGQAALSPEEIYEKTSPSVLTLEVENSNHERFVGAACLVVRPGLAVTAWHVVHDAQKIEAWFSDHRRAKIVGLVAKDEKLDLALIEIEANDRPRTVLATNTPRIGAKAFVIGAPKGMDFSIADGLISQVRELEGVRQYQLSCPISPGNSGGPVLNDRGELVGIVSWREAGVQNLSFAVPSLEVLRLDSRKPAVPWPVRVVRVLGKSDSFPEKGTFNGERVKSDPRGLAEFRQALAELAGKRVTLTLETGGAVQSFNFEAPLDERGFPVRIKE